MKYEHKLNTKLINNLNQIKSHPQHKLNGKDYGKRNANTKTTHDVLPKRKPKPLA